MNGFHEKMGLRLFERRKQLGITQEELAEMVGLSTQMISSAELGKKAMRPENIVKICNALKISTDYLLTGQTVELDMVYFQQHIKNLTAFQLQKLEDIIKSYVSAVEHQ